MTEHVTRDQAIQAAASLEVDVDSHGMWNGGGNAAMFDGMAESTKILCEYLKQPIDREVVSPQGFGHSTPQRDLGILRGQQTRNVAMLQKLEAEGHHGSQAWGNLAIVHDETQDEIKRLMWLDWPGDSPKES
jgi:hypothetical protein